LKKNDVSTSLGLILGAGCIIFGMILNNGKVEIGGLKLFFDLPSVFITVGGSFFSVLICYPMSIVKGLPKAMTNVFIEKQIPPMELIDSFVELSKQARKEGLLSLESSTENLKDNFLKSGVQMIIDGMEPDTIRDILELDIGEMEKRHTSYINLMKAWAGYGPAFGMIGTLIGLVQMLSSLSDPSSLGPGMSKAIITSFYGSVLANFVFGPLAAKLENKNDEEVGRREMMLEGVLSLQSGVNPRIIEEKLKAYLTPDERIKMEKRTPHGEPVTANE
jgi:chemotaxis protein MotA